MALGLTSIAQITVDSSDVINPGSIRYQAYFDNYSNTPINAGNASATAQTWDFSSMNYNWVDTLIFTTPANADFPSSNQNANLALNFGDGSGSIHLINDVSGLFVVEYAGIWGTFAINETWANFPMTYGSSFNWSTTLDTIMVNTFLPFPGADIIYYKKDTFQISEVDAFGTIITELGTFDALRIKQTGESNDSIWYKEFPTSHSVMAGTGPMGMEFDPDTLTISVLDTVHFTNLAYHNAIEVDEATYLANGDTPNGGFLFPLGSGTGTHVFDSPGTYYYVCGPHAVMGMKGMITVVDDWTLFQTSENNGEDNYTFWTNDADTAGMPLMSLYADSLGIIYDAEFIVPSGVTPETWDCIGNACVDPGDGTGQYSDMMDCVYLCSGTDIENNNINLSVYPNPAKDQITFDFKEASIVNIYSSDGKMLFSKKINGAHTIDVSKFAHGLYLYQAQVGNQIKSGTFQILE